MTTSYKKKKKDPGCSTHHNCTIKTSLNHIAANQSAGQILVLLQFQQKSRTNSSDTGNTEVSSMNKSHVSLSLVSEKKNGSSQTERKACSAERKKTAQPAFL